MNIFKKIFLKKKTRKNMISDNAGQNSFDNYDFSVFDETVPLNNFEFEDFGATVLLNSDDSNYSDETVLLNSPVEEKAKEIENSSIETMLNKIYLINPLSGEKVKVSKQIFTIGSGNDVDYKIYKPNVSSNHALIFVKDANEFYMVDNSSTNGTQVEGVSIEPMKMVSIENGDLITFGEELYQFYIEE